MVLLVEKMAKMCLSTSARSKWKATVALTRATLEQMNQITGILDEGLRQGALGVGTTVAYMRNGTTTYELFEVQRAAARYGRLTAAHTRFHGNNAPPTEAQMGGDEFIFNGMLLNA